MGWRLKVSQLLTPYGLWPKSEHGHNYVPVRKRKPRFAKSGVSGVKQGTQREDGGP